MHPLLPEGSPCSAKLAAAIALGSIELGLLEAPRKRVRAFARAVSSGVKLSFRYVWVRRVFITRTPQAAQLTEDAPEVQDKTDMMETAQVRQPSMRVAGALSVVL